MDTTPTTPSMGLTPEEQEAIIKAEADAKNLADKLGLDHRVIPKIKARPHWIQQGRAFLKVTVEHNPDLFQVPVIQANLDRYEPGVLEGWLHREVSRKLENLHESLNYLLETARRCLTEDMTDHREMGTTWYIPFKTDIVVQELKGTVLTLWDVMEYLRTSETSGDLRNLNAIMAEEIESVIKLGYVG